MERGEKSAFGSMGLGVVGWRETEQIATREHDKNFAVTEHQKYDTDLSLPIKHVYKRGNGFN